MWWLLAGLCVFILLLAWALWSCLEAEIVYKRVGEDDRLIMKMRGFGGLVRYKVDVPVIRFHGSSVGLQVGTQGPIADKDMHEKKITRHTIERFYRKIKTLLEHTDGLLDWMCSTLGCVRCSELRWTTSLGLEDAAETAWTVGAVWTLKTSAVGWATRFVCLDKPPQLMVNPHFNQPQFATELRCKLHLRLGQALFAGIQLLRRAMRVKGGVQTWRRTLFRT